MMTDDDAELLLDENFIAMEDSHSLNCVEDENTPYYAGPKYKKKNDFNFTSLWRKPKIGRRKTKSIGKNQDAYERASNDKSSSLKTIGKYVKDRESFGSMASIPLSDFDEAKDTLPFLHFRPDFSNLGGNRVNSNARLKDRTVLNPKMILTQPPAKRRELKKDNVVGAKWDEDESRDIFKPIHNNNNNFDAFQILPKESPKKMKVEDETRKKQRDEEVDGVCDKENFFKDSIDCGDLYHDHGPILSSLSEDTINSDYVRGEQFLDENFNEKMPEIDTRCKWNKTDNERRKEGGWGFSDVSNQDEMQRVETATSVDSSAAIETKVRSFSDRLKLFQSKANQPAQQSRCDYRKPKFSTPIGNLRDPTVVKHQEETNENLESAMVPEVSELEIPAPDLDNCKNFIDCEISKPDERVIDDVHQISTSKLSDDKTHSDSFGRNVISSRAKMNYFPKQQITKGARAPKSSYQSDNYKHIDEKKSLTSNSSSKFSALNSEKSESKVVDLSMIKNRLISKCEDGNESVSPTTCTGPSSSLEEEKLDSLNVGEDSRFKSDQNISDLPRHSVRSYSTKYCSSSNSQQSASRFGGNILGRRDPRRTEDFESELISEIDRDAKLESSGGATHPLEIDSSNEPKDHTNPVAKLTPTESEAESNKREIKIEKPHNSFKAATLRFGGKFEENNIKFGRDLYTKVQGGNKKESYEEENDEKEKTNCSELQNSDNMDNIMVVSKFDQLGSIESQSVAYGTNKSFGSLKSEVIVDGRTNLWLEEEGLQRIPRDLMKLKDRDPNLRKSSLNPQSENSSNEYIAPSVETRTPITNALDAEKLESENEIRPEREASNDSTRYTSIISLPCKSISSSSFAQQSASIFGVTLSKARKKRIESASGNKECTRLNEKSIEAIGCAGKPDSQDVTDGSQTIRAKGDVMEKESEKYENNERKSSIGEEHSRRKFSTFSIDTCSLDRKVENGNPQLGQEEGTPTAEHSLLNRHIGSSCQPVNFLESDVVTSVDNRMELNASDKKVETIYRPEKVKKTLSISDRRKMFEQATTKNLINFNRDNDDFQGTTCTDTPKSVVTSESHSFDDLSSISTKRRSTESEMKSVHDGFQIQLGQAGILSNSSDENRADDEDDEEEEYMVGDRRKTLKSMRRGTDGTSNIFQLQPKSSKMAFHVLNESEVLPNNPNDIDFGENIDNDDNMLENRSNMLKFAEKHKSSAEQSKNSFEESSPPRTAYSARRKFFENLDRKRVQSSMSRPLIKRTEPMSTIIKSKKENENESIKHDDTLRDSNGLPMFVSVEEDFLLKDNISTCLSASENRSVVCRPDALLYSVSQKAIALMSAKAENNLSSSFSKNESKETIHNGFDQKRVLTQRMKFNLEASSSNNAITATDSQLRNRFARKNKTINSEGDFIDDVQDDNDRDTGFPLENQQANKSRTSEFSLRTNRFARKKVTSEVCQESKYDEELDFSTKLQDKNGMEEPNKMRTTIPFHRPKSNSFEIKKLGSEICHESKNQQLPNKEVAIDVNTNALEINNVSESNNVQMEENTDDHVRNPDDKVRCIDECLESSIENEDILEKQKTPPSNDVDVKPFSEQMSSMSIRARRKFFESQCEKIGSVGMNKGDEEETTVPKIYRKSPVPISNRHSSFNDKTKIRRSEDSETTPLVGANIVEQCESLANNIESESTFRTSDFKKRFSSTSMGTLDYSLSSLSNSRQSDLCNRAGSTSTYTNGTSSVPIYRKGFSSAVIRSSTASRGKKKSDLRCF